MDRHPKIGDLIFWEIGHTKRWALVISEPKEFHGGHYGSRAPTHIVKVYSFTLNRTNELLFDFQELKKGIVLASELD